MTTKKKAEKRRAARSAPPRRTNIVAVHLDMNQEGAEVSPPQSQITAITRAQLTAIVAALVYTRGESFSPDDCVSVAGHILTAAGVGLDEPTAETTEGEDE